MKIFCTDLDNTIIYSYKRDIGEQKLNVEIYQGREISFITNRTYSLLQEINKDYLIIPTTTRTLEQYNRIDLGIGQFEYALTCNGGVLLVNGQMDREWYEESLKLIMESTQELDKAISLLEKEPRRTFELRFIEKLFVFTKCDEPEKVVEELKAQLDTNLVDVFNNGVKVYVVPTKLSKGMAIKRLRERMKPEVIIAAGDSEFDVSMVEEADCGLVPYGFIDEFGASQKVIEMEKDRIFAEALLEKVSEMK